MIIRIIVGFLILFSAEIFSQDNKTITPEGNYLKKIEISDSTFLLEWGNNNFNRIMPDTFDTNFHEPYFEWENEYAIGLYRGCGSPCWYEYILPLNLKDSIKVIPFPLENNLKKNLTVYIEDNSSVAVFNFKNDSRIITELEPKCNSVFTGNCISSIIFEDEKLIIKWYSNINFSNEDEEPENKIEVDISSLNPKK